MKIIKITFFAIISVIINFSVNIFDRMLQIGGAAADTRQDGILTDFGTLSLISETHADSVESLFDIILGGGGGGGCGGGCCGGCCSCSSCP